MSGKRGFEIRTPTKELRQSQEPIKLEFLEDFPFKSVALGSTRANLTGLWRYWRPYYRTRRAPCDANCPVGNGVVDFIQALLEGHTREAANILRGENPLPAITGRVCHRPCEINCNRRSYDKRIAIHDIEAALADIPDEGLVFPSVERPRLVAVVGSGPAELAFAHFMALLHHRVTVFEDQDALGGVLRHGRQARLLSDGVLDSEIDRLIAERIHVEMRAVTLADLEPDFEVVFGRVEAADQLTLHLVDSGKPRVESLAPLLSDGALGGLAIKASLRVSEAIGFGKWAALLLDAEWRGLDATGTLAHIQVGGNIRIVSALKYMALLTGREIERSERIVTYDMLHLEVLDEVPPVIKPEEIKRLQSKAATGVITGEQWEHVLREAARCFCCGRCNNCDNCWVYCPDAVISRVAGKYEIDYDYCKGCTLCAAVCPRGAISIIEESKKDQLGL